MNDTKPTKVTDAELWEFRALTAELGKVQAEMTIMQQHAAKVEERFEEFRQRMMGIYGEVQLQADGTLVYPDEPAAEEEQSEATE
jgi:hypothetical protein